MTTYDKILETTAVISTVLQFLSGAVICRKYIQKKSTGDSSGFPFLCGFLSCSIWLLYGLFTEEDSVVLVNAVGTIMFLTYTLIYYIFTVKKVGFCQQLAFILLILFCAVFCIVRIDNYQTSIQVMGVICCIVTVCFFAAPLTMLLHVMRVKSSESLPFPLIAMSFLVSLQWLVYGIIIHDPFIQITNFLGSVLSMLQLCLFVCYPPRSFSGQGYKLVDHTLVF